jgi:hypothetical protein
VPGIVLVSLNDKPENTMTPIVVVDGHIILKFGNVDGSLMSRGKCLGAVITCRMMLNRRTVVIRRNVFHAKNDESGVAKPNEGSYAGNA